MILKSVRIEPNQVDHQYCLESLIAGRPMALIMTSIIGETLVN